MKRYFLLVLLIPTNAAAGAWLQPEGEGQLINNISYYNASNFYDSTSDKHPMGAYQKYEFNPYFEYGLMDVLTIGGSFAAKHSSNAATGQDSQTIDDISLFTRSYLYDDGEMVVSFEPGFEYSINSEGDINAESGFSPEIKLNVGFSTENSFYSTSSIYSYKPGDQSDKIESEFTYGYHINEDFTFLGQVFTSFVTVQDYTIGSNYDLVKLQPSMLWEQNEYITHQLGVSYDAYGRNTGAGIGFLYSVWYKF